jgi:hypothetical protein
MTRSMEKHAAVVCAAMTEAAEANATLRSLAGSRLLREATLVRRVFLFETEKGVGFGFSPEEYGSIEPFASVPVSADQCQAPATSCQGHRPEILISQSLQRTNP